MPVCSKCGKEVRRVWVKNQMCWDCDPRERRITNGEVGEVREGARDRGVESEYDSPLDSGIAPFVEVLRAAGIETYESCQGGEGHAYLEPTIRFHGTAQEGFYALGVAIRAMLPVSKLSRIWVVNDGEPTGPHWEMVFWKQADRLEN